jgi:hypothetical protein
MDEDILHAIFIHYIGIRCCVILKTSLRSFIRAPNGIWKWHTVPPIDSESLERRKYYLGEDAIVESNVNTRRASDYNSSFFLSQLPEREDMIRGAYDAGDPEENEFSSEKKEGFKTARQLLLKTLTAEMILQRSLKGEAAIVQTDLKWFATGLSHTTVFAVMRFFGFPESIIEFFRKVLQAPLNVYSSSNAPSPSGPRDRKRGVPIADAPEKLLGELVLFVLDLAVNQESGLLLYRWHDDLWLCGDPKQCAKAWSALENCARMLGLEFNLAKTGSVYLVDGKRRKDPDVVATLPRGEVRIGHLLLDPENGKWQIDQKQVNEHVVQLKKQLSECKSVLQWVQTWNSCIGRFFGNTFGEPAFCLGSDHVTSILRTYQSMQQVLFGTMQESEGSQASVTQHIKGMIESRFGVSDIPDSFIFLPEQLGGLGVRNPFISLLVVNDRLAELSPEETMQKFFEQELGNYKNAKKTFEEQNDVDIKLGKYARSCEDYEVAKKAIKAIMTKEQLQTFFTFEDYTACRESTSEILFYIYEKLLEDPHVKAPYLDADVLAAVSSLNIDSSNVDPKASEIRWALQLYGPSLRQDYGGLRLVDEEFLPLGVLAMMRRKAVRWNLVL